MTRSRRDDPKRPSRATPRSPRSARSRHAIDTSVFPDQIDALLHTIASDGIEVPLSTREVLLTYVETLVAWSSRVNLVSRAELPLLVEKHVAASMTPLLATPTGADVTGADPTGADPTGADPTGAGAARNVLDIGSGGGLPGIVLAAARPGWIVTLCEPLRRKTLFLTAMAERMPNLRVRRERAEEAAIDPELRARCDLVTSRAVAHPDVVWPLARPFLAPAGELHVFVARDDHDRLARTLEEAHGNARVDTPLLPSWHRGAVMRVRSRS